ncbi:MAG: protein translocase subunit SecF [Clostridiales bacterium]|nr:protein translocase subunit SecF [Clostridiales bacterium]
MKKLDNLLEKDFHIVEKRKIIFAIPLAIVFVAIVMMIIFNFTLGSPLNLGTDFTGGYSIDVTLGNKLTDENYESYYDQIVNTIKTVTADNGKTYNITVDNMQRQGSGAKASIHVKYFAVKGATEAEMIEDVNPAIQHALEDAILLIIPNFVIDGNTVTVTYSDVVASSIDILKSQFTTLVNKLNAEPNNYGLTFDGSVADAVAIDETDGHKVVISFASIGKTDGLSAEIRDGMRLDDPYAGDVTQGDLTGATVSTELLFNAVLAVALALVFMLCYIGIRFQLSSGLACIIALFHDIIMMFAFMAICHIEINSTFIAALITILGYSINNSIIIFDRVRENMKSVYSKNMTAESIANKSIRETLLRSINTTITTLIMILMVAIIGVTDIRIFAFPIIIGLISGTFSSICIAPSFWALFQRVGKKNKGNFTVQPKKKNSNKKELAEA